MSENKAGKFGSRIILAVVLIAALVVAFIYALPWLKDVGRVQNGLRALKDLGLWGGIIFIAIYIVAVVLFIPASILTLGAGFAFGMVSGSIYVLIGANISATLCFIIGRYLARDWIAHKVEALPKFKAIDDAVAREGWKIVALIRLAPVFPFSLMSYAFGLTRVPFWSYAAANLAMIPGTLMYVYFGSVLRDLTQNVSKPPWIKWTIGALTVIVVIYVTRFAKRALTQRIS